MILEFLIVVFSLSCITVLVKYNHPMYYGMGWVCLVINISAMLSSYSGVYGFTLFMSVVSGVLVVFAYSISLSPLILSKKQSKEIKVKPRVKNLDWDLIFYFKRVLIPTVLSCMFFSLYLIMLSVTPKVSEGWFSTILYMSSDWALGMVLLSVMLFLVMVFCVSVASKLKGALIK
uniref:NADH dehydrogenase subunit 6 n=1 Tax=Cryptonema producta TaxID=870231 RepID=UPI00223846D8|nr:NADH dehydrogenase subunit 6 [Cryptonema producta]UYR95074.1 NADH dehydrogenase subunit 6 [Cryptonema producta]